MEITPVHLRVWENFRGRPEGRFLKMQRKLKLRNEITRAGTGTIGIGIVTLASTIELDFKVRFFPGIGTGYTVPVQALGTGQIREYRTGTVQPFILGHQLWQKLILLTGKYGKYRR